MFEDYLKAIRAFHLIRAASIAQLSSGEKPLPLYQDIVRTLCLWNPRMAYQADELWIRYRKYKKQEQKSMTQKVQMKVKHYYDFRELFPKGCEVEQAALDAWGYKPINNGDILDIELTPELMKWVKERTGRPPEKFIPVCFWW